jgi:hypothetical protein
MTTYPSSSSFCIEQEFLCEHVPHSSWNRSPSLPLPQALPAHGSGGRKLLTAHGGCECRVGWSVGRRWGHAHGYSPSYSAGWRNAEDESNSTFIVYTPKHELRFITSFDNKL